jgi:hypothetical protein
MNTNTKVQIEHTLPTRTTRYYTRKSHCKGIHSDKMNHARSARVRKRRTHLAVMYPNRTTDSERVELKPYPKPESSSWSIRTLYGCSCFGIPYVCAQYKASCGSPQPLTHMTSSSCKSLLLPTASRTISLQLSGPAQKRNLQDTMHS